MKLPFRFRPSLGLSVKFILVTGGISAMLALILTTVATKYTRNAGYPGYTNAAVQEALDTYLIPSMFAQASQGRMTAEESVRAAGAEAKRIWAKWRKAGML